jgi:hypothetical protein
VEVLRSLAALDGPGLPAFERATLVRESGFPSDRVASFAVLDVDAEGWLRGIREKPDPRDLEASGPHALISMNVWRFDRRIFDACADAAFRQGIRTTPPWDSPSSAGCASTCCVPAGRCSTSRRGDVARVSAQSTAWATAMTQHGEPSAWRRKKPTRARRSCHVCAALRGLVSAADLELVRPGRIEASAATDYAGGRSLWPRSPQVRRGGARVVTSVCG